MKKFFIPLIENFEVPTKLIEKIDKELPKEIAIFYSIQYEDVAKNLIKKIKNKKITKFCQILGCSKPILPKETKAILLIGEGRFHSNSLAYESKKEVYLIEQGNLRKIDKNEIKILEKKERAALTNFLNNNEIGILIANKPGQSRLKRAIKLKDKVKNKKFYFFLANEINIREFENFGLKSWINTACPRMDLEDNRIINLNNLIACLNLSD